MTGPENESADSEIIARVRRHDEHALRQLLEKYRRPLRAFSFSILRCRDLAELAVSNVFLKLWQRRETIVIKTTVRRYLYAAAGNQSINLWNARKRRDALLAGNDSAAAVIDARSVESDIRYRELWEEVEALLAKLPPQRQLVFRLSRIEGMSHLEIARELTLSEHTVQNHMTEAVRQILRDSLLTRGSGSDEGKARRGRASRLARVGKGQKLLRPASSDA